MSTRSAESRRSRRALPPALLAPVLLLLLAVPVYGDDPDQATAQVQPAGGAAQAASPENPQPRSDTDAQTSPQPESPQEPEPAGPDLTEAKTAVREGRYDDAEAILAKLQSSFPDDGALLLLRGEVLLALHHPDRALPVLLHGVEVAPKRPRMNFQLGTAQAKQGKVEEALASFARELKVNPDPKVGVLAHLNRAVLFEQSGRREDAAGELEAVLQLDPSRKEVYGDLALVHLQAGEPDRAREALATGEAHGFRSARHEYALAVALYRAKRYEEAAATFTKALAIDPSLAEAEKSLAGVLEKLDRHDEAREHLKRYLEMRPDAPDAAKIRERLGSSTGP